MGISYQGHAAAPGREYDLYRVDAGQRTRLTTRPGPEGEPAADPTGRLLAFVAPVDGRFQVFTMPRFERSRCPDPGVHDRPISAIEMLLDQEHLVLQDPEIVGAAVNTIAAGLAAISPTA